MNRSAIASQAEHYLGSPFKHQGRTEAGIDCIGLAVAVSRDLGLLSDEIAFNGKRIPIADFDEPTYSREPTEASIVAPLERFLDRIEDAGDIRVGDVLLFRVLKRPQHIGIVTELSDDYQAIKFVHAYQPNNRVRRDDMGIRWHKRLISVYRFRDSAFGGGD